MCRANIIQLENQILERYRLAQLLAPDKKGACGRITGQQLWHGPHGSQLQPMRRAFGPCV